MQPKPPDVILILVLTLAIISGSFAIEVVFTCPLRPIPENGRIQYESTSPLDAGAFVEYTCNTGYSLEGAAVAECLLDGTWSEPEPTCVPG